MGSLAVLPRADPQSSSLTSAQHHRDDAVGPSGIDSGGFPPEEVVLGDDQPRGALSARRSTPPTTAPAISPVSVAPLAPASSSPPTAGPEPATLPNDSGITAEQGFLNINSIPVSYVILDGKPIGSTPKPQFPVSPGSHSVLFLNPERGFKNQISVTVGAGETRAAIGVQN
jgi:serine/threonine-protein kinase